jgi:hypothetical protein
MNPKTKIKVAIDIVMTSLFLILMNLAWTGLRFHEILGLSIVAFFAAHVLVNRQWIATVARRFRIIKNPKVQFMFILDAMLGLSLLLAVISGILISQYLFPGLTDLSFNFWFIVHQASSWASLGFVVLHAAMHGPWIANIVRQMSKTQSASPGDPRTMSNRLSVFAARVLIGFFALVTVYSIANGKLLDLLLPAPEDTGSSKVTTTTASSVIAAVDETAPTSAIIQPPATTTATEEPITLQQYLSRLTCTACHKHCLLSSPRCARGVRQTERATIEYNEKLEAGTL